MLRYCLPLIPASLFWWVTNVSDRYMVTYIIDETANGLYSVSYKIPTLINLLSSIFMEAWHMSAISEKDSPQRSAFFSKVFRAYSSLLFCAGSFLTLSCRFFMRYLVADSYFIAWRYIPVLILATVFCCFANFLNSVYVVERKSTLSLLTVMAGALANIILNLILIPWMGVMGAAVATMLSYLVVFALRIWSTRSMIKLQINYPNMGINTIIIIVQAVLMLCQVPYTLLWSVLLFVVLGLLNLRTLLNAAKDILLSRKKS
jgi:O-antigen/teichoic acid export membrane protein